MSFADLLRNIAWRPGIGDPSPAGWLTVLAYFTIGLLAAGLFRAYKKGGRPRRESAVWLILAAALVLLGLNKQLDLQSLLTDLGREISKTQGWYGDRQAVQVAFIGALTLAGGAATVSLGWLWRRTIQEHWLVFLGVAALIGFVLVRAVSFHVIDRLIQERFLGIRLNTILELGSLLIIGSGLWRVWRIADPPAVETSRGGRRMLPPLAMLAIALAAVSGLFQLLSTSALNWQSDFDNTIPPYRHPNNQVILPAAAVAFRDTFDTFTQQPIPFADPRWDVTVHTRDWSTWEALEPLAAVYGANCAPPPAVHTVSTFEESVFMCDGRLVSAINGADYAATVITPAFLLDFSDGPAQLSLDISTVRTSGRDWVEIWITPFDHNLQLPGQDWMPDMNGHPPNAIHLFMDLAAWRFSGVLIVNNRAAELSGEWFDLAAVSEPSYTDLTTLKLILDGQAMRFGLPQADLWWVDDAFSEPLTWRQGVVQISHHSFEPTKDCEASCGPNSWVFDNVSLEPAVPFTIVHSQQRYVNRVTGPRVTLTSPSPERGYLRFVAFGDEIQVSFDGGITWQVAGRQNYVRDEIGYQSYWLPLPPGIGEIHFRGRDFGGNDWQVRDISVWSLSGPD